MSYKIKYILLLIQLLELGAILSYKMDLHPNLAWMLRLMVPHTHQEGFKMSYIMRLTGRSE